LGWLVRTFRLLTCIILHPRILYLSACPRSQIFHYCWRSTEDFGN
jgi:hypothetical protein